MDPDKFYLKNFPGKFYQTSEEEPVLILPRYFQTIEEVRAHPNAFCEASIPPDTKDRHCGEKKLQTNIPCERRCKNPQQNTNKPNSS